MTQCTSEESHQEFQARRVDLADDELLATFRAVRDYQAFWRNWLHSEPHLAVTYEALIESPGETLKLMFDFLCTPLAEPIYDVPLRKLNHPVALDYWERLKSKLAPVASDALTA